MKCLRHRISKRHVTALGVLALAPVVWVAFVAVLPTGCARKTIVERLARATGRQVTLGSLHVGALGGVTLGDLKIGAPGSGDDPWLQVDQATVNVSLMQLMFGQLDPTEIEVEGVKLRVLRRADGSLELADLLRPDGDAKVITPPTSEVCEPSGLEVTVSGAMVTIVDEPTGSKLELTGVSGRGTCQGCVAHVTQLRGSVNGGTFELAAQADKSEAVPRFEGQLRVRGAGLSQGMSALGYLVPVLAGTRSGLDGKLTLDLYLRGQGDTREGLAESLVGQGRIGLDPVALDGSKLLSGIGDLFELPPQGRVGDVWGDLKVQNGRIMSDNLTVDVSKVPLVFVGWTDFEGRVNYRLKTDGLSEKLPAQAHEFLSRLRPGLKVNELADVKIQGTVEALSVTAHGVPIARGAESQKLQEIGRRVRDQIRR
jgi:AsmA protein